MPSYVLVVRVCPTCRRSCAHMVPADELVDSLDQPVTLYECGEGLTGPELDFTAPEEGG